MTHATHLPFPAGWPAPSHLAAHLPQASAPSLFCIPHPGARNDVLTVTVLVSVFSVDIGDWPHSISLDTACQVSLTCTWCTCLIGHSYPLGLSPPRMVGPSMWDLSEALSLSHSIWTRKTSQPVGMPFKCSGKLPANPPSPSTPCGHVNASPPSVVCWMTTLCPQEQTMIIRPSIPQVCDSSSSSHKTPTDSPRHLSRRIL